MTWLWQPLLQGGELLLSGVIPPPPDDGGMADPGTHKYVEPWDRGYYLWKYGHKQQKKSRKKIQKALEDGRPEVMQRQLAEIEARTSSMDRDIEELEAYLAGAEAAVERELANQEESSDATIWWLEQNMRNAREALLMANTAKRRRQNLITAVNAVIRLLF
jgi:hypothetical protein